MSKGGRAAKKIAVLAALTALSLITFLLESLLPPLFIPGAKPGLANVFSLIALILYSPWEAFLVVAVRTFLGACFAGNLSALLFSFTGGIAAMALSSVLLYCTRGKISVAAVSVAAAVLHNAVQCAVYALITKSASMLYYMPYLMLVGVLSGAIVGATVYLTFKKIPLSVFEKVLTSYQKTEKSVNN